MSDTEIGILDLLQLKGFDAMRRIKFVRHKDARVDVHDFLRRGWLERISPIKADPCLLKPI